jgi:hypothetical protein
MTLTKFPVVVCAMLMPVLALGCVHAARDTTGFAVSAETSVAVPFEEAWQGVKAALREQGLETYTRDKRGVFVAYTPMARRYFQPKRIEYTLTLNERPEGGTNISVSAVRQTYGVTPLTYPDWHARKTSADPGLEALIQAIESKCAAV